MVEISSHCHVIVFFGGWWVNLIANIQRQSTSKVGETVPDGVQHVVGHFYLQSVKLGRYPWKIPLKMT